MPKSVENIVSVRCSSILIKLGKLSKNHQFI